MWQHWSWAFSTCVPSIPDGSTSATDVQFFNWEELQPTECLDADGSISVLEPGIPRSRSYSIQESPPVRDKRPQSPVARRQSCPAAFESGAPQSPPVPSPPLPDAYQSSLEHEEVNHSRDEGNLSPKPQSFRGNVVRNVVVFGETGVGKSSVINMITGGDSARVSSEAKGCTVTSKAYEVSIGGCLYKLWDTAGLNEGEGGTLVHERAVEALEELVVKQLEHKVDLLLYCIRARRIRPVVEQNYQLLCNRLCKSKVPIALVVTCVENMMAPTMDAWWRDNRSELERYGLKFNDTVCVVSTRGLPSESPGGGCIFDKEYTASAENLRDLVKAIFDKVPQEAQRRFASKSRASKWSIKF
ncbi:P-loop containing nucleoside triphosphate hydrolase protein [Coprinopsis marcescibilis]|uniref:P-loop containing nucleoside triphosphate hydrolase protein n=1 Tax=Coprinopsis marcescibilis TaxID=230819 RepID=A0A5C3KPK2_COPMA|nr:P-loop containing nucleoside triphosphate hydrolase protein [Coprinopsis marcescibilis]